MGQIGARKPERRAARPRFAAAMTDYSLSKPELIIFIGLPGAGKSRFYRSRFAKTHALISKDLMPNNRRSKTERQAQLARELLAGGGNVAIDNTNICRVQRKALLIAARECGARVTGYYFDVSRDDCRARNATRAGRACVPEFVIGMIGNQLQMPTYAEGFDALLRVVLAPDGAPVVRVWNSAVMLTSEIRFP